MRFLFSSLVVVSALAAATPAFGQALSAQDEAQQRFQTGLKYYDQRDFESARLAFTQAYAVIQKPSILQNLAFSELYSNHPLDAVNHFDQYMKDPSVSADKKAGAKRGLDEAMKKTGHYAVKLAPEASLTVDGKAPPAMPPSLVHVMPGSHVLEAKLAGKTKSMTSEAKAGETTNVDLSFDASSTVPPPPPPLTTPPPPPPVEPPPEPKHSSWSGARVGVVIAGAALAVTGAVFIGLSFAAASDESSNKDKANQLGTQVPAGSDGCTRMPSAACTEFASAQSSRNDASDRMVRYRLIGIPAAAVGAGLVVTALVWPGSKGSAAAARLTPMVGPQQAGFVFSSTF